MTTADVHARKRISPVWIVPIAAALIGAWMIVHAIQTRGPMVQISFASADGIEAGKTRVRMRAVGLGTVEGIELAEDLGSVVVHARLDREVTPLLRDDTQFWVVRPHLGPTGISGLSTILSGPYIEMSPGGGRQGQRAYRGLEDIPVTPPTASGLHVSLVSASAAALAPGNPVLFKGYRVGRVESADLDPHTGTGRFGVFIEAPYDALVTTGTRFWNASGISVDLSADGLSVSTGSMEALIAGGVTFSVPDTVGRGEPVADHTQFTLYPDEKSAHTHPFAERQEYVLLFDTSVRGLSAGAPVQYRGMRIGTVEGVSFDYVEDEVMFGPDGHIRIPVLVRLDPARIGLEDTPAGRDELNELIAHSVDSGLRATLMSGNLITGRLFVALDFFDDVGPASVEQRNGRLLLPTESTGLEQIEHKVSAMLDKLQALQIEPALASATQTLDRIGATAASAHDMLESLDAILDQDEARALPASLDRSLNEITQALDGLAPGSPLYHDLSRMLSELRVSLTGIDELTRTLAAQPNALVFARPKGPDPEPRGAGQ